MSTRFESDEAKRLTKSFKSHFAILIPAIPFLSLFIALVATDGNVPTFFIYLVVSLLVGLANLAVSISQQRLKEEGKLSITEDSLVWKQTTVARKEVTSGLFLPTAKYGPTVVLRNWYGGIIAEFAVKDEVEGRAILQALGLDARDVAASFVALPKFQGLAATLTWFAAAGTGMGLSMYTVFQAMSRGGSMVGAMAMALLLGLAPMLVMSPLIAQTNVLVGTDGLLLKRMGRKRFVSFTALRAVEKSEFGVNLLFHDGTTEQLLMVQEKGLSALQDEQRAQRDALLARIQAAMATHDTEGSAAVGALLHRGDRGLREWIESLRAAATRAEGGMRTAPLMREHLWNVLRDSSRTLSERAAAAVAIASGNLPEEKEKLRAEARAVASPKLRVVLEQAAETDAPEALEQALEELSSEQQQG